MKLDELIKNLQAALTELGNVEVFHEGGVVKLIEPVPEEEDCCAHVYLE